MLFFNSGILEWIVAKCTASKKEFTRRLNREAARISNTTGKELQLEVKPLSSLLKFRTNQAHIRKRKFENNKLLVDTSSLGKTFTHFIVGLLFFIVFNLGGYKVIRGPDVEVATDAERLITEKSKLSFRLSSVTIINLTI